MALDPPLHCQIQLNPWPFKPINNATSQTLNKDSRQPSNAAQTIPLFRRPIRSPNARTPLTPPSLHKHLLNTFGTAMHKKLHARHCPNQFKNTPCPQCQGSAAHWCIRPFHDQAVRANRPSRSNNPQHKGTWCHPPSTLLPRDSTATAALLLPRDSRRCCQGTGDMLAMPRWPCQSILAALTWL